MKNYAYSIRVLFILTLVVFPLLFITTNSVYDILLAIFGSSFVSLLICIIGYNTSKIDTLEDFYDIVKKRVIYWSLYDIDDDLTKKCEYYVNYYTKGFPDVGRAYSKIYFLLDFKHTRRNGIYHDIYLPCLSFSGLVEKHYWHFKWYLDGTGKNYGMIKEFIAEIEDEMINKKDGSDISGRIMEKLDNYVMELLDSE